MIFYILPDFTWITKCVYIEIIELDIDSFFNNKK